MTQTERGIALVTGASSGIGLATARALKRDGYKVYGTSRKPSPDTADGVTMLVCDVVSDASVKSAVDEVLQREGRIDLLVNNAGLGMFGGAEESSAAQAQALFDANVFGVMRMTNAVLPSMRRRGKGRIINMGSILGRVPGPYAAHYSAAKHAVEGYSESLDHEVRAFNIRVSVIEPAFVRTIFDQNGIKPDSQLNVYDRARSDLDALLADVMPKADLPEVVADVIVRAAADTRPRRRYTAGAAAKQISILRRFAPAAMFDKILRKQFRLPA